MELKEKYEVYGHDMMKHGSYGHKLNLDKENMCIKFVVSFNDNNSLIPFKYYLTKGGDCLLIDVLKDELYSYLDSYVRKQKIENVLEC